MISRRLKLLGLVILGLVLWKFCGSGVDALREEGAGETKYLLDRMWVDHVVESPKEVGHALFLGRHEGVGATVHGSAYRFLVNGLRHQEKDGRLSLTFLQENVTVRPRFRVFECRDAPKDLDLCLVLDFRAKKVRLYSAKRWQSRAENGPTEEADWLYATGLLGEAAMGHAAAVERATRTGFASKDVPTTTTDSIEDVGDDDEHLPSWFADLLE
ncbi:MAG: hypothetical protein H6729_17600 [Deltaproteobacteria bacterium]|nr:hypothetical protein [Deltaproteobacteria bacterium]